MPSLDMDVDARLVTRDPETARRIAFVPATPMDNELPVGFRQSFAEFLFINPQPVVLDRTRSTSATRRSSRMLALCTIETERGARTCFREPGRCKVWMDVK